MTAPGRSHAKPWMRSAYAALGAAVVLGIMIGGSAARGAGHGIAMHGPPKYRAGFTHFDHVDPAAPKGGTLRLATVGSFDSLNPFIVKGQAAWGPFRRHNRYFEHLVFESLMRRSSDEAFTLYGLLAETVEVPPDRRWIIFSLDPKARFQDGHPVTPEDVLFSLKTLRDHGMPNHRFYYSQVQTADILDSRRVKLTFAADGNREMPLIMGLMPILPAHHFKDRAFGETSLRPVPGSGPYRVAEATPGRRVVFTRDPDYWGADLPVNRGLFNFDTVILDFYRDGAAAFEAFKSGEYDLREVIEPQRWHALKSHEAVKAGRIALAEFESGWPAPMRGFIFNTRHAIFADKAVRRALGHAFDFQWVNAHFFHGAYERTESYVDDSVLKAHGPAEGLERRILMDVDAPDTALAAPPRPPGIPDAGARRKHLRLASRMLDKAGWRISDGRRRNVETGQPFTFEILIGDPRDERVAVHFARNLERLGVTANVRTVDSAQYQARLDDYDFDMIVSGWDISLSPGNELSFYFGSAAAETPGTRNYPGIRIPAVDRLITRIVDAAAREELIAAMRAIDRILLHGHYLIPLYHSPAQRVAFHRHLGRPESTPLEGYVLESWWDRRADGVAP